MVDEKTLAIIIGSSVGMYPKEVTDMLVSNKILSQNVNYTIEQLVEGVLLGLNSSTSFTAQYSQWIEQIGSTLNLNL